MSDRSVFVDIASLVESLQNLMYTNVISIHDFFFNLIFLHDRCCSTMPQTQLNVCVFCTEAGPSLKLTLFGK